MGVRCWLFQHEWMKESVTVYVMGLPFTALQLRCRHCLRVSVIDLHTPTHERWDVRLLNRVRTALGRQTGTRV